VSELHQRLASEEASEEAKAFEQARGQLMDFAKTHQEAGAAGFSRLAGLLAAAKPYRTKDNLSWLSERLNLRWDPEMKEVLEAWQKERHALAHGREPSEASVNRMFLQSRLAGGINLIIARIIGYSGLAVYSVLEDRYTRLPLIPSTGHVITQEEIDAVVNPD
jgi:hypothetical protein